MPKRKKRIEKAIKSLEEQINFHLEKIMKENGEKDTTKDYWKKEIKKKKRLIK